MRDVLTGESTWAVAEGDCLSLLRELPEASVGLVATDPPYGISFMGREWDRALPDPTVWRECLRVLKPGGSAVVMSGSRLDCLWRMCRDLEAAGFELSQTALYWCYRSGFPKGGDLSKAADRAAGAEREVMGYRRNLCRTSDTTQAGAFNASEGGMFRPDRDVFADTAPATPLAQSLDGWYTRGKVKPAVEVIIWARKPTSERTELANMVRWDVGGVNCGECMVPYQGEGDEANWFGYQTKTPSQGSALAGNADGFLNARASDKQAGRYPANLLVTQDALGERDSRYFNIDAWAREHGYSEDWAAAAEAGLLQVAKPSRAEKEAGCEALAERPVGMSNGAQLHGEGYDKGQDIGLNRVVRTRNHHPTVKPVALFAYLVSFLTKPGALVVDPFAGSGTTGVACAQTGRRFLGMDLDADYCTIARARIAHAEPATPAAPTLFASAGGGQ